MTKEKHSKKNILKKEIEFIKTTHPIFKFPRTFGQKTADNLTKWAGSWTFIISFFVFIFLWITTSGYFILKYFNQIDKYPFIILNLILSCLAAVQAPIILMSQNRENQRDRLKAQYDYSINKKAEKEIREIKKILLKQNKK